MKTSSRTAFATGMAMMLALTTVHAIPWNEVVDAGGLDDPQQLVSGPYDAIAGNVGGGDFEDAYAFHWLADGDFSAIDTEPPLPVGLMAIALYSYANGVVGNAFTAYTDSKIGISVADLLAGDYVLHLVFDDDGADPPYFLQLSGPIGAIGAIEQVPEPTSLMLLWAAALAVFATRLRSARRSLQ